MVGSAWTPCERPMVGVILCSKARRLSAASSASTSAMRMSLARLSCTARQVSSTSELVSPRWTNRASGPMNSARWVRNAITSCLVTFSISSIRADVEFRLPPLVPDRLRRRFRDHADLGHRLAGVSLDLEPDAKARLGRPDGGHLGAGIAGDHWRSAFCLFVPGGVYRNGGRESRRPELQLRSAHAR